HIYDTYLTYIDNTTDEKIQKRKITITVDEDDPCLKRDVDAKKRAKSVFPGEDPRFQQQNQTLRCWVMYHDFYRCEHILGEKSDVCTWFKQVFTSICPNDWIRRWDELRIEGKLI
ncbi:cytochrome c oxidase subunit 6B1-like, partial [Frieseomelitta varia]|uniref:cytochrome c oxidase subunit 6B1-like n=1 Tax=Frieseomelitta varia TaxID=561572 RepID=UPI001CB68380